MLPRRTEAARSSRSLGTEIKCFMKLVCGRALPVVQEYRRLLYCRLQDGGCLYIDTIAQNGLVVQFVTHVLTQSVRDRIRCRLISRYNRYVGCRYAAGTFSRRVGGCGPLWSCVLRQGQRSGSARERQGQSWHTWGDGVTKSRGPWGAFTSGLASLAQVRGVSEKIEI